MGQLKRRMVCVKKTVEIGRAKIDELRNLLSELRTEHKLAILDLEHRIKKAYEARVVEIDTRLDEILRKRNKKVYAPLKKQINKLRAERFDLECYISGV